jgi:hypothetical protein
MSFGNEWKNSSEVRTGHSGRAVFEDRKDQVSPAVIVAAAKVPV